MMRESWEQCWKVVERAVRLFKISPNIKDSISNFSQNFLSFVDSVPSKLSQNVFFLHVNYFFL